MRIHGWMAAVLLLVAVQVGCGGNGATQTVGDGTKSEGTSVTSVKANGTGKSPAETGDAVEAVEPPLAATASPAEVVSFFLDSLQAGDTPLVAGILTKKARVEMSNEGYEVKAEGLPGTEFKIGRVEYVGNRKDGAHVETLWTAAGEEADPTTFTVTWVLRKQEKGWRIAGAGMAYDGEETGAKEFVNFENPRETYDRQQEGVETATKQPPARRPRTRQE